MITRLETNWLSNACTTHTPHTQKQKSKENKHTQDIAISNYSTKHPMQVLTRYLWPQFRCYGKFRIKTRWAFTRIWIAWRPPYLTLKVLYWRLWLCPGKVLRNIYWRIQHCINTTIITYKELICAGVQLYILKAGIIWHDLRVLQKP